MRKISVRMSGRSDTLVHLYDVNFWPRHVRGRECSQHPPGCVAAAHGHHKTTPRGDGFPRLFSNDIRGLLSHRFGGFQHFDTHGLRHAAWTSAPRAGGAFITGLFHPSAGTILFSTSAGPQVPGSYSYTGV